jgi:hypothetical protein
MIHQQFVSFIDSECWGSVPCKDVQQMIWRLLLNDPAILTLRRHARKKCVEHDCSVGHCILRHYEPVPALCEAAIKWDVSTIEHVPPRLITYEMQLSVVSKDGMLLRFITDQTPDICEVAVQNNPMALQYVREQTPELCLNAIRDNGLALEHVRDYTEALGNVAVAQNGLALRFIQRQTVHQCRVAIRQNTKAVHHLKIQLC